MFTPASPAQRRSLRPPSRIAGTARTTAGQVSGGALQTGTATRQRRFQYLVTQMTAKAERRSPTGIARERETSADNPPHLPDLTPRSAGLRPASRGSAKPAPTTPPHPNLTPRGAPVSDRHRAAARNQRRRRRPTPISRPGAPVSDRHRAAARNQHRRRRPTPISRPKRSAGLRPASRGSAKPPTTRPTPISRPGAPVFRPASRGSAKPAPTTRPTPISRPRSAGLRPASRGSAKPAPTTRSAPPLVTPAKRSAGLRPASRGSAKPAPTTLPHPSNPRHARETERRSPTGIARERETSRQRATPIPAKRSAGLPGIARHAKPAPTTRSAHPNLTPERRSPTGIARERETSADNPERPSRSSSQRDRERSAGLRPASRGSAKPAPMTPRPANLTSRNGAPVSDRARGALFQILVTMTATRERRSPTGIARERETSADDAAPCQPESPTPTPNEEPGAGARFQILVTGDRDPKVAWPSQTRRPPPDRRTACGSALGLVP